jgi:hypothetical protein
MDKIDKNIRIASYLFQQGRQSADTHTKPFITYIGATLTREYYLKGKALYG